jgi:uncharacterized cupredoxin-like copper-binding protein
MKPKHQRLLLAVIALLALIGAGLLAASALREEASYFYTPTTLAEADVPAGRAIRLGGMVQQGSIKREADGVTVSFVVQDRDKTQKDQGWSPMAGWPAMACLSRTACWHAMMKITYRESWKIST